MGTARRGLLLGLATAAMFAAAGPSAGAYVYWANKYDDQIGRAGLDGSEPDQAFVSGLGDQSHPVGVAVDSAHLYWANYEQPDSIGRANIDGSCPDQRFVTGASDPVGVAVDSGHVYWTNAATGTIGRARLDGTHADQRFVTGAARPYGIAVDDGHVYWTNLDSGAIGRADLDGANPDQSFITDVADPTAVAVDAGHVYWTSGGAGGAIGRADLDGANPDPALVAAPYTVDPWGLALGAGRLWWTNQGPPKTVGRADLDGHDALAKVVGASEHGIYGVAVDSRTAPPPPHLGPCTAPAARPRPAAAAAAGGPISPRPARSRPPPRMSRLAVSPSRFAARRGTRIRWRLSEPATTRFRIERRGKPHGAFRRRGARGANRLRFRGRLKRRWLPPGRYRLVVVAMAGGRRSRRASVRFRVLRPRASRPGG